MIYELIAGFLASDPLCEERPAPEHQNECCVLVVCATSEEPDEPRKDIIDASNQRPDQEPRILTGHDKTISGGVEEPDTGSGIKNIRFLQITSTTVQLQFPGITGGNLMYVEDRLFNLREVPWENTIILEGNKIFTLRDLKPGTKYR